MHTHNKGAKKTRVCCLAVCIFLEGYKRKRWRYQWLQSLQDIQQTVSRIIWPSFSVPEAQACIESSAIGPLFLEPKGHPSLELNLSNHSNPSSPLSYVVRFGLLVMLLFSRALATEKASTPRPVGMLSDANSFGVIAPAVKFCGYHVVS